MGKDRFIALMRVGLGYNRQTRMFYIENSERIEEAKSILSEILGDDVIFAQKCSLCDATFTCDRCGYADLCGSRDAPAYCICLPCRSQKQLYEKYVKRGNK